MIRTLSSILDIRSASGTNRFIYYFKRIPMLGKLLKDDIYANAVLKRTFSVIVFILKVLWGFMSKFAYIGILIYGPVILTSSELPIKEQYQLYLHIVLFLSFIVAAVSNVFIMEPKRDKYICVKLMRLPASDYMRATLTLQGLTFLLYFLPPMMVFASLLGAPVWQGAMLALLLTAWRTITEALNLWLFAKKGIVLAKKLNWVWSVIGVGFLLAYLPLYLEEALISTTQLFSVPLTLVILVLGIAAGIYIARYPDYREAVDAVTKRDEPLLDVGRMMKESRVKNVQTIEQDYTAEHLRSSQWEGKKGYAYLNAIFFSRHKRLIIQPMQRRLVIVLVFFLIGIITILVSPETSSKGVPYLMSNLPIFLIIMNYTSIGERLCRGLFNNCDLSLLRYGFYRKRAAILHNFTIRLFKLIRLNLLLAAAISVAGTSLILLSGADWALADVIIIWITILCLSLFFSVHHLFMYYIFQPYSTELGVKNPLFTIVNSIVLAIGFVSIQFQSTPVYFVLIVLLATLVYMIIALFLIYKFSATTFRVK
ncbi:hypothetical protein [Paenibacillus monticola]|uniref:Uncharacterized protein n=1 Tax=Paenibacillus monticola TaxID=2666075 RepID=A0A7X2H9K6_9BACL|nr:hypothetical protein [Paenibacillus monticola]MRN55935.1 hypothetical protein [Paenibacillus monticola]